MTINLTESAKLGTATDGSYPIVLISPGQGTSGYYHEQVIRDYAPTAFPKGTHVYLDHLKEGEQRTPEKLLGTLIEDTTVNDAGEAVNRFKPLRKHAEWIEEVKSFVGMSVAVRGSARKGEVDGNPTAIVESLDPHITNTVDVVSYAGRGGRFLESFLDEANAADKETPSTHAESSAGTAKGNDTMTLEEQLAKLIPIVESLVTKIEARESAEAEAAEKVAEAEAERVAAVEAAKAVAGSELTESVRADLYTQIAAGNYDVQGVIDRDKALREEIRQEFTESGFVEAGASAAGSAGAAVDTDVKGW